MTEPGIDRLADKVADMTGAVRALEGTVAAQARDVKRLDSTLGLEIESREVENTRLRRLLTAIAAVAVVALLAAGLGVWSAVKARTAAGHANRALAAQVCINAVNDDRARDAITFYVAEYRKVNGQYIAFLKLRNASIAGDHAGSLKAFDEWLKATGGYRDGPIAKKLAELGVTIHKHADGSVDLIPPPAAKTKAGCP